MYYTNGDTLVFRADSRTEWSPSRRRERAPGLDQVREPRRAERSAEHPLADRVAQLEARLERLEADLAEARQAQAVQATSPSPSRGGRRSRSNPGNEVKVSLHAEDGAQATVGQVRMLSED